MAEREYKIPISLIEKIVNYVTTKQPNIVVDFSVQKIIRREKPTYRITLVINPELSIENYENNLQVFSVYKSVIYYLDRILCLDRNKVKVGFSHHFFRVTPLNHTIIYRTPTLNE